MDGLLPPIQIHQGDEAVGPGEKPGRDHAAVAHKRPPFPRREPFRPDNIRFDYITDAPAGKRGKLLFRLVIFTKFLREKAENVVLSFNAFIVIISVTILLGREYMDYPKLFVCLMGMGTVFFGLICLIALTMIMSAILGHGKQTAVPAAAPAPAVLPEPNRQEVIAAVSAAVAEELGLDITGIRILSMKKL